MGPSLGKPTEKRTPRKTPMNPERIHKAIRTIRQRIFDMPENRQPRATRAIQTLKTRLPVRHPDRHWMYAAE